jgi:hypothetical protein
MHSLKQIQNNLDKEINFLATDPEQVDQAKILDFLDRDIAGEVSEEEADNFFSEFQKNASPQK